MRRRTAYRLCAAALAASLGATISLGGVPVASAGGASATPRKGPGPVLVSVADFYFGPSTATIKKGGSIKWVWASTNTEPHDVHLKKGPKGLKKPGSYSTKTTAVTNAEFKKVFETPGTYNFICTIHPTKMKMTVTVKK
jgi:plastocyanin